MWFNKKPMTMFVHAYDEVHAKNVVNWKCKNMNMTTPDRITVGFGHTRNKR
jgi:hypothetical protein